MKRKRFCKSLDLKVATLIFGLSIQLVTKVVEANTHQNPSSFHISNKIIHYHHHKHQQQPTSDSISAYSSQFNNDPQQQQQDDLVPTNVRSHQVVASESLVENPTQNGPSTSEQGDNGGGSVDSAEHEEADNSHELADRNMFLDQHNSQLQAMHDLFERRQLNNHHHQLQASQELSPISIGLDPVSGAGSPFNMPPFTVPNHDHPGAHNKPPQMANVDNLDQNMGPGLPFNLNPLPQLLGFQSPPFDGPQRGDQSAHANHHTAMSSTESEVGQKVWPKTFRFTDGRINLSEFEKQKKIRLSSKNQHNTENHIESAPIMFDGRQLKRKSFLILHGGIFSK